MEIISNTMCSVCKKENKELVVFETKIVWFIPKDIIVCQSCISKAFRSFRKGK